MATGRHTSQVCLPRRVHVTAINCSVRALLLGFASGRGTQLYLAGLYGSLSLSEKRLDAGHMCNPLGVTRKDKAATSTRALQGRSAAHLQGRSAHQASAGV